MLSAMPGDDRITAYTILADSLDAHAGLLRRCGCWLDPIVWGHSCKWPDRVQPIYYAEHVLALQAGVTMMY